VHVANKELGWVGSSSHSQRGNYSGGCNLTYQKSMTAASIIRARGTVCMTVFVTMEGLCCGRTPKGGKRGRVDRIGSAHRKSEYVSTA
jgi:hypothetical protein